MLEITMLNDHNKPMRYMYIGLNRAELAIIEKSYPEGLHNHINKLLANLTFDKVKDCVKFMYELLSIMYICDSDYPIENVVHVKNFYEIMKLKNNNFFSILLGSCFINPKAANNILKNALPDLDNDEEDCSVLHKYSYIPGAEEYAFGKIIASHMKGL